MSNKEFFIPQFLHFQVGTPIQKGIQAIQFKASKTNLESGEPPTSNVEQKQKISAI